MLLGTKWRLTPKYTKLSHSVTARYFKFVPKIWSKGGWACMRLEMFGCSPTKG